MRLLTPTLVCEYCNRDDLSPEERIEHLAKLLEDTGLLEGLLMVHGRDSEHARRRYQEVGGLIHLKIPDKQPDT